VHLADALSWLATSELRQGKAAEAEAHHRASLKAVDDCGLLEISHRALSLAQFLRVAGEAEKHKALLAAWAQSLLGLAERRALLDEADKTQGARHAALRAGAEHLSDFTPAAAKAVVGSAAFPPLCAQECLLDVFCSAAAALHERAQSYAARGKLKKAALLSAGPLLALAVRIETFPTAAAVLAASPPGGHPPTLGPLPLVSVGGVLDSAAALFARESERVSGSSGNAASLAALRLRVGHVAGTSGAVSFDSSDFFSPAYGGAPDAKTLAFSDAWKAPMASSPDASSLWLPQPAHAALAAACDAALSAADAWPPSPSGIAAALAYLGRQEPSPALQSHGALALAMLPLANVLLAGPDRGPKRAGEAARAARAAAYFAGLGGMVGNQGEALHLLGCALFHAGGGQNLELSALSFSAAATAKRACGADGGPGLQGGERSDFSVFDPARLSGICQCAERSAEERTACSYVDTLLWLGKVSFEVRDLREAETANDGALQVARARLGDSHQVTRKALQALVELRTRLKAMSAR
jgi:hypothetical protein